MLDMNIHLNIHERMGMYILEPGGQNHNSYRYNRTYSIRSELFINFVVFP